MLVSRITEFLMLMNLQPIRDLLNGSATSDDNLPGMSKSSSTPLLDDPNPSWIEFNPRLSWPIRDLLNGSATSDDNLPGMSKSSSTPLLDDPNPSWEWSQMNKAHDERIAPLLEAANQRHFSGYNVTESVLQKFRKSFSLRFYKKSASNSSSQHTSLDSTSTAKQYQHDFEPPDSPPHT
ncbi:uncharacterized protein LOC103519261, partial [Diaphorina citri]|uniref:Uncharacterized protein LOC103519261 n=1 Tax=Diaphorina citri TaxID=121845 RepID=A0A1S3DIF8_DIACI